MSEGILSDGMINKLSFSTIFSLTAKMGFSTYKLYTNPDISSKVVDEINDRNASRFIQFHTNKEKLWSKYVNSKIGQVGWLNIGAIKKKKLMISD